MEAKIPNNTACAFRIYFLWSHDDFDRSIRFLASVIALPVFRLGHSIYWSVACWILFHDHYLRSFPQNKKLVQKAVHNFIASFVDELKL